MPARGGAQGDWGGDHASTEQYQPPPTGRDEVAPPPFPAPTDAAFQVSKKQKQEEQQLPPLPAKALAEILSRVPYKSLCRFKCVSKPWLALCSDPAIRKRSPQTLSGFFFNRTRGGLTFRNLSGGGSRRSTPLIDPKLPFLRGSYKRFEVEQGCGSVLLLRCWKSYTKRNKDKYDHVVCNPATEEWRVLPLIVLPDPEEPDVLVFYDSDYDFFLGFEADTPSQFVVFAPLRNYFGEFGQVAVYSSETGRWTALPNEWGWKTVLLGGPHCVFLNGIMHLSTHYASIVTVDTEGKNWGEIEWPKDMVSTTEVVTIGKSQGLLHAWQIDNDNDSQLYVWVLEDYASGKWTLKHTVKVLELFGRECYKDEECFTMFAIHPDRDLVYLTDEEEMTVSYDMDSRKVQVMCTAKELACGVPYTPCFTEWSSAGN